MRCDRAREAVSARIDAEPIGVSVSTLEHHLATCTECARWADDAERVTRLLRLDVRPVPDLSDDITATVALPMRRVLRRRLVLRVLLLVAGIAQVAVGLPAALGDSLGMAMAAHAAHEAAAWNLAIGAAFVAAAALPRRATGLIPLLGTFLVVLGVLSVHDIASGAVGASRLATHIAALVGLVLLVMLDRAERALPPRQVDAGRDSGDADGSAPLRTVA